MRDQPKGWFRVSDKASRLIARHIEHHIRDHKMPMKTAVAAALDEVRRKGYKVPRR